MRLAVTADLHWGLNPKGDAATRELARRVVELAPDAFVIAGDIGEGGNFPACLQLFSGLHCARLVLPGNHDLWTRSASPSSLRLYETELPALARAEEFLYLDQAAYVTPGGREAIVGSINWYDYSFADSTLDAQFPDVAHMYRAKRFPSAQHNDGNYVRLGLSDEEFTARVVSAFQAQLAALPSTVERVTVLQHHPPVWDLFYPTPVSTVDQRFWLAYTGNRRMQEVVLSDPRVRYVFCGHTHAACVADVAGKRCLNIGGDYGWKRLLVVDTESEREEAWEFGN